MEVRIQGIHFDISEKLTQFINKKAEKLSRKYPKIDYIEVVLRVVKPETAQNKETRINVIVPHEAEQVATKVADTFEEGIDLCLEAIEHQLERAKDSKK